VTSSGCRRARWTRWTRSYERWDGKGWPGEREGERIPLAARVIQLAEFAEVAYRNHGIGGAVEVAGRGSATQFDPNLVAILRADAEKIFRSLTRRSQPSPASLTSSRPSCSATPKLSPHWHATRRHVWTCPQQSALGFTVPR
jgi:hypothetical protein